MTEISDPLDIDRPPSNRWAEVWRQFRAHKGAMAGALVFGLIIAGVFLGPFIYPHDPQYLPSGRDFITLRDTRPIYVALWDPSAKVNWQYVLGTDNLGRDNLARFLSGGRVSISVGLTAMILSRQQPQRQLGRQLLLLPFSESQVLSSFHPQVFGVSPWDFQSLLPKESNIPW